MTMSRREANEKAGTSLAERTRRSTRSMAHELQERRVALISELVSLHQRVASMLKVIMLREGHDALRSALGRQHAIDLHIAERLLNEARSHGIRPGPIAQVEVTALLEEVLRRPPPQRSCRQTGSLATGAWCGSATRHPVLEPVDGCDQREQLKPLEGRSASPAMDGSGPLSVAGNAHQQRRLNGKHDGLSLNAPRSRRA